MTRFVAPKDAASVACQSGARRSGSATRLAAVIVVAHGAFLASGAAVHSPTLNEPGHLAAGLSNWALGRFDAFKVNPPLVRMAAALPLLAVGCEYDWKGFQDSPGARPEVQLGEDFVAANGGRSFWLFTLARWACIPFSLPGGWICFRWARELYGPWAGLLALALWCFCPNILGHGALITPDVAATSLGAAACYTFWRWLKEPDWWHAVVSGLALGLAELTKMTLVIFFALWPLMWLVYRWPECTGRSETVSGRGTVPFCIAKLGQSPAWLRELAMLAVQIVVAIYVLNLGYGFEGSLTPLGKYQFTSATFRGTDDPAIPIGNRFEDSWLGGVPVPAPKNYLQGMDLQKRDFEHYPNPSYLRGEFRKTGWWYYYLYALAIKVPLGTWVLFALAAITGLLVHGPSNAKHCGASPQWHPRGSRRDEFVLLTPAAVILVFVSSQTGFSEHMRYVLPILPFVFIFTGRVAVVFERRHWVVASIAIAALAWSIASSLWVYPHSLSYFNELVGGPMGGPKHLIHSNVDWGQDLLFLKKWLNEHPEARPLKLAYFGYFDPMHAGIEYTAPEPLPGSESKQTIHAGWYAISVNFVRGLPYFTYKGDGSKVSLPMHALSAFQSLKPVATAGYSIYIYHVQDPQQVD